MNSFLATDSRSIYVTSSGSPSLRQNPIIQSITQTNLQSRRIPFTLRTEIWKLRWYKQGKVCCRKCKFATVKFITFIFQYLSKFQVTFRLSLPYVSMLTLLPNRTWNWKTQLCCTLDFLCLTRTRQAVCRLRLIMMTVHHANKIKEK